MSFKTNIDNANIIFKPYCLQGGRKLKKYIYILITNRMPILNNITTEFTIAILLLITALVAFIIYNFISFRVFENTRDDPLKNTGS